ncbi:MAG: polysaccharide biosynthesis protein [Anaerolineae bacterium]|nr:polysaccharide biosynthesis protein [Anaerolineae bacterium]
MKLLLEGLYERIRRNRVLYLLVSALVDAAIMIIAYATAFSARAFITPIEYDKGFRLILFDIALTIAIFYILGIYHRIWSRTSGHGMTIIIQAVFLTSFITVILSAIQLPRPLPLSIVLLANLLSLSGFIAVRYRSRLVSGLGWRWNAIWKQKFPEISTRVLIIGAGQSGQEMALRLRHRSPGNYYTVVGFVDDDVQKVGMYVENCQVLGHRSDIAYLVEKYKVDLIIVAIHNISGPNFRDILTHCESTKARIKVAPDLFASVDSDDTGTLLRDVQPEDLLGRSPISRHESVDLRPVMNRVVLVTGAAGSIGSELARQLPSYNPTKLLLLDSNESGLHDLYIHLQAKHPNVEIHRILADITVRPALEKVFKSYRPQIVFHAAAYKHVPILQNYPDEAVRVNIGGTRNVAELAQHYKAQRFVLISTDKAVNPSSVMGASKRICELMVQSLAQREDNQTIYTSVRFGNVLGSRGSVVVTFNEQITSGGPVTVTHKDMTRYFMTIPEAVNLVIHAGCMTKGGEVFLLKMGEVVKIVDLAERMIRLRGLRPYQDIKINFTGIRPGEKMHEQLYDGAAESASETEHPGIIQLSGRNQEYDGVELMAWVDYLLAHGLDADKNALFQLLWGMTPNEKYAIMESLTYIEPTAADTAAAPINASAVRAAPALKIEQSQSHASTAS